MSQLNVDLAIIGSGSGNSLISEYWDNKKVAIAEQGVFGGTCLNVGCIPTKMFVRPALLARTGEEAERLGLKVTTDQVDWKAMRERIFARIDTISDGGRQYRQDLENVELIAQRVSVGEDNTLRAEDGTQVHAKQLVIAAGSRPVLPPIPGTDLPGVHTSDTVMRLEELPGRIIIIGGGYIACEFAGIFSGLGAQVVQLVRRDKLMRHLDAEICDAFNAEAAKHWQVQYRSEPTEIRQNTDGTLTVETSAGSHSADVVLLATGRRPNTDLIGAAAAGLDMHEDGRLVVDEYQRVQRGGHAVTGVYALGDISSDQQLKHVANYEARLVAHNLENPESLRANSQRAVPAAVFTYPELAQVGMTEEQARQAIGEQHVTAKTQRYGDTAYGWAMEEANSLFKVVADKRDGRILGAHAMGYQSANLIQPLVMAMNLGIDAHRAARGQYWIHPALMEVPENALLGLDVPVSNDADL